MSHMMGRELQVKKTFVSFPSLSFSAKACQKQRNLLTLFDKLCGTAEVEIGNSTKDY